MLSMWIVKSEERYSGWIKRRSLKKIKTETEAWRRQWNRKDRVFKRRIVKIRRKNLRIRKRLPHQESKDKTFFKKQKTTAKRKRKNPKLQIRVMMFLNLILHRTGRCPLDIMYYYLNYLFVLIKANFQPSYKPFNKT